jgi:ribosomal protein S18 acetylase RimI-like enzyme
MYARIAQNQDVNELGKLFNQLDYSSPMSEIIERMANRIDHVHNEGFVAVINATIVGVIALNITLPIHKTGKWAVISALAVGKSVRGTGVGTTLLKHAELYAQKSGCTQIRLSSSESRAKARAFYQRHGFVEMRKRFANQQRT